MAQRLKEVFDDLYSIEINIIFKSGMTGRKMPEVGKALIELADAYESYLTGKPMPALTERPAANSATFAKIQEQVGDNKDARMPATARTDNGRAVILRRIWRNSDELKAILGRTAALETMSEADLLAVRKMWEVGTEEIVMQTVIQLDGDIVTRMDRARAATAAEPVQELHNTILATALGHWHFLFRTVAELTTETFQRFLPR